MHIFVSFMMLIVTLFIGIPVPMAFFAVTFFLIIFGGYDPSFLLPFGYNKMSAMILIAMPLFIMAGGIIEKGKLGDKLVDFVEIFFGRFKGGLGAVSVVSCALFGAISGSSTATMTVIGQIMWPRLDKAGYDKGHTASLLSSAALLGSFIPPSGMMILYAWIANQSVLECFLAVLGPGIILTIWFSIFNYIRCKNNDNIIVLPKLPAKEFAKEASGVTFKAIPALMFPVIILGGIYGGLFTPTEAAAVSVLYAIPVGLFIYKGMKFKELGSVFIETATNTGVIVVMLFCVMMLSRIYVTENLPDFILSVLNSISQSKYVILLMINLILIIIGMLMDDVSAMMLTTPILMPVITHIGVDPVHFAAIMGVNLGLACITPPCAPLLFLGSKLSHTPLHKMLKPTLLLIIFVWVPMLVLTTFIPDISLFLPHLIMGK